jgi:hypothetical protein
MDRRVDWRDWIAVPPELVLVLDEAEGEYAAWMRAMACSMSDAASAGTDDDAVAGGVDIGVGDRRGRSLMAHCHGGRLC